LSRRLREPQPPNRILWITTKKLGLCVTAKYLSTRSFCPNCSPEIRGARLRFSDDLKEAVRARSAVFVGVGTPPTESGEADLLTWNRSRMKSAAPSTSTKSWSKKAPGRLHSDWIRKIILRNGADPELFDVASNPEFLREGTAVTDFLFPDRIVVGCDTPRSAEMLREIYVSPTNSVGDLGGRTAIGGVEDCDLAFHAARSFWWR
jgi:hypothetical protein